MGLPYAVTLRQNEGTLSDEYLESLTSEQLLAVSIHMSGYANIDTALKERLSRILTVRGEFEKARKEME